MNRELEYKITSEYEGMKIADFLRGRGYKSQALTDIKKMPESVLVNGKWEYMTSRLQGGDCLVIRIQELENSKKIPPIKLDFGIVYEDEDIIVVNKPAKMPIHPSLNNYENTLGNALAYYYEKQGKAFIFRCVNRLDRDTTGLTIVAKHLVSAGILYDDMKERKIKRTYQAIVCGSDLPDSGTIDLPIAREDGSSIKRIVRKDGEVAITHYKVLERMDDLALVEFNLETGRTHQIRVHMKAIGHPLIGDFLYNPDDRRMERQALHAARLEFKHPISGQMMDLRADLPLDMCQIIRKF